MVLGEFGEEGPEHGLRDPDDHIDQPRLVGDPEHPEPERNHPDESQGEGHRGLGKVDRGLGDRRHLHESDRGDAHLASRHRVAGGYLKHCPAPEVVVPLRGHCPDRRQRLRQGCVLGETELHPVAILDQLTGVLWGEGERGAEVRRPGGRIGADRDLDLPGRRVVAGREGNGNRDRRTVAVGVSPEVAHVRNQREGEAQDDEPGPDVVEHSWS